VVREDLLSRTLVELADTLVEDYDPMSFCTGWPNGAFLARDGRGRCRARRLARELRALASSSERMRLIELIEVQREDGPCLDSCIQVR